MVTGLLDLLDELDGRGVALTLTAGPGPGPLLQTDAPAGAITSNIAAAVATHRDMVVAVPPTSPAQHQAAPRPAAGMADMTLDHLPLDADPADIAPADALRRWLDAQPGWRRHAACAGTDPSVFFPVRGESTADALHVCGRCPVLTDCREWAIADASLDYGVLGGMTARARKAARRARRNRPSAR